MTTAGPPSTESEAAMRASMELIARLPGARVGREADLTLLSSGRPFSSLNHVQQIEIGGSEGAIDDRIAEIHADMEAAGSVPATWWVSPSTRPKDLARRLVARGFVGAEPEFGMAIDIGAARVPEPMGADVSVVPVATHADLDEWLSVMAGAYRWSGGGASSAWAELYGAAVDEVDPPWRHFLVREASRPVACSSMFYAGGLAFVTNIGTVPDARGHGLGTVATRAALDAARQAGHRRASLAASLMGRGLYARLGFVEECRLDRFISPP